MLLLDALKKVGDWAPANKTVWENIIHLCKDNIEGIVYQDFQGTQKGWTLTPEYEAKLRAIMAEATQRLQALDPSYETPAIEKKKPGGCFVVTATMGDANHPTVLLMRTFRDEWIIPKHWGPHFVQRYYQIGPKAARVIASSRSLRRLSYAFIVAPLAWLARHLIKARLP